MKNKIIGILASLTLASTLTAAPELGGSLKFFSPKTGEEITSVRIGNRVKIKIRVLNPKVITNENITFTYALSVVPNGSSTPTKISGKLSGKFQLPESEGGAAQTTSETESWADIETIAAILEIPDFMPEGVATLTISLATENNGSYSRSKSLTIRL